MSDGTNAPRSATGTFPSMQAGSVTITPGGPAPAGRAGYRPVPPAHRDAVSVCERCRALVCVFDQESHDAWHAASG